MSAELQLPRSNTLDGFRLWAQSIVNVLRRQNTIVTERVEAVETITTEVETDNQLALDAMVDYAADVQQFITDAGGYAQDVFDEYEAAAAAGHAKLASHYLTQAANSVEQNVRISEDEVTSEKIDTVAAYLQGTSATISDIETSVANGETAIATRISTVQSQANGNSASIQTITSSASGTDATYALVANSNGHIKAGFVLATGTQGSNITFLADKFIIAHPSVGATVMTPFVVGLVNGISTVGISGNLIVDGTILARHIATTTLSAIAANVGTVTAGVLRSSDSKFVIDLNNKTITITT